MYTYNDLLNDVQILQRMGAETSYIGASASGRMIPLIHIGRDSGNQVLIQGAIHAREHITAQLTVELIYYTMERYKNLDGGIYFIPMSNPDGVSLCQFGLDSVRDAGTKEFLLDVNGINGSDFTYWKANINAVDLNCNFPARWGTGVQNVTEPAPESYIGPWPASEPETRALMDITRRVCPQLTISYHCKGLEIFWQFYQTEPELSRDRQIAEVFAAQTGYALIEGERGSAGGYKDWCIEKFMTPNYTFETVDPIFPHPISYEALLEEFPRNKDIPKTALDLLNGVYKR